MREEVVLTPTTLICCIIDNDPILNTFAHQHGALMTTAPPDEYSEEPSILLWSVIPDEDKCVLSVVARAPSCDAGRSTITVRGPFIVACSFNCSILFYVSVLMIELLMIYQILLFL